MARNDDVVVPAGVWTLLTNSNTAAVALRNKGVGLQRTSVLLKGTIGAVAPVDFGGCFELLPGAHVLATETLADMFPGVSGANNLYAWAPAGAVLSVSHA